MNPQDRNKAVGLIVAIILTIGVGFYFVKASMPRTSPEAAPLDVVATKKPAPEPAPAISNPAPGKDASSATTGAPAGTVNPTQANEPTAGSAPASVGSPFKPVLPGQKGAQGLATGPDAVKSAQQAAMASRAAHAAGQGPTGLAANQPGGLGLPNAFSPVSPVLPEALALSVKGIVENSRGRMAVITYDGKTMYVTPGEKVATGFHVAGISRDAVRFATKKKAFNVHVGETVGQANGPSRMDMQATPSGGQ